MVGVSLILRRRKNLIPVNFLWENNAPPKSAESTPAIGEGDESKPNVADEKVALCPSCKKTLSNSGLMYRTLLSAAHAMWRIP